MNENNQKFKNDKFIVEKEGLANFFLHSVDKNNIPSKSMVVFYNKKMEINRDITNLAIMAYNKLFNQNKLVIVDSMAASGIGSIRMLKECKNVKKIYINDINPIAIDLIKKNIQINNLKDEESLIKISKKSANLLFSELALMKQDEKPDIISIDPFGTPNLYIDS
ncbi:MAG: 50S ribosomal protein L11 methyltransferase, partial [Candidatus Lokiarchaeota archaeon]|nr:50S ribosomal protein L11 methyltransferase [Candidatus Lokiarchaeota archaeon]